MIYTTEELLAREQQAETLRWIDRRILWQARNDVIVRQLWPDQINEERSRWVASQRERGATRLCPDFVMRVRADEFSFFLLGDTGDGGRKQFALARPLMLEHRKRSTDFMIIASDLIYPAGDVNEYIDKFYLPYQQYDRPIYGLPGNHDWYDGLNGFMFNLCGAEPLPRTVYRPSSETRRSRIARRLWRRASRPQRQKLVALRNARPPWRTTPRRGLLLPQPGPYFALEFDTFVLVLIDTGIIGTIDLEQADWLLRVSSIDKRKILLTGKPLRVDGEAKPCTIDPLLWHSEQPPVDNLSDARFETVEAIVRHKPFQYVAAIGGDIHNYQHYEDEGFHYFVNGGGGAYLSATHRISGGFKPKRTYPSFDESIEFYSRAVASKLPAVVVQSFLFLLAGIFTAVVIRALIPDSIAKIAVIAAASFVGLVQAAAYLWRDRSGQHRHGRRLVWALARLAFSLSLLIGPAVLFVVEGWGDALWVAALAALAIGPLLAFAYPYVKTRDAVAGLWLLAVLLAATVAFGGVFGGWLLFALAAVLWLGLACLSYTVVPKAQPTTGSQRRIVGVYTLLGLASSALIGWRWGPWPQTTAAALILWVSAGGLLYLARIGLLWFFLRPKHGLFHIDPTSEAAKRSVTKLPHEPAGGPLTSLFSEFFDFDCPPLYKSFMRIDVTDTEVVLAPFAVTGDREESTATPIEEPIKLQLDSPAS